MARIKVAKTRELPMAPKSKRAKVKLPTTSGKRSAKSSLPAKRRK